MFGRVYENMDKNEFLLRFRGELQEPVDHALSRIEENLDVEKPNSSDDVIREISIAIGKYYQHELDEQFHKPEVNPFQKMPSKYTEDCINALIVPELIDWILGQMVSAMNDRAKIHELEEECEQWLQTLRRTNGILV